MRARNVKPGFFQNEQLAELPFEARLLFVGLWCLADREGRLEDRPKRIKMNVFPADSIDIEPLLDGLVRQGLIDRYEAHGVACIEIPKFLEHQRPHANEQESRLPTKVQSTSHQGDKHFALNPDSLNPESSPFGRERSRAATDPEAAAETRPAGKKRSPATRLPDDFELTDERRLVAEAEKLPAERTFAKFVDYWRAASGSKARKHDWDATWRNWCRTEADRPRGNGVATRGTHQQKPNRFDESTERLREWVERGAAAAE